MHSASDGVIVGSNPTTLAHFLGMWSNWIWLSPTKRYVKGSNPFMPIHLYITKYIGVWCDKMNDNVKKIDIGQGDADIYVDGQLVLQIGQVSDEDTINLFLYPKSGGEILESLLHQEDCKNSCTHEVLIPRRK
jgi:hypothetical protein